MPTTKAARKKAAKRSNMNVAIAPSAAKPLKSKSNFAPKRDLAPERVAAILKRLAEAYPNAECALHHRNAWELLVATILSAQCTDARVNMVTPELFHQFPTPKAMSEASLPAIEEIIRSTGFYRNKAKSISGAAKKISSDFGGKVPRTMAELLTIPGAARKTASVVLGVAYGLAEGIVVDTHVLRISRRLHLTQDTEPKKVEQDLMKIIPKDRWIAFSHEVIHHGRQICIARKPKCVECPLETLCTSSDKTWSSH
ncbi:MAG TPA: endonuclease III [Pseudacidobacterium sp.]|jgi:endonuclease-3|nr:endonuclease III [Pseudacidobacterium sp.]